MRVMLRSIAPVVSALFLAGSLAAQERPEVQEARTHTGQVTEADSARVSEGYFTGADGLRLFYRAVGDRGDTLVVLHGGPGMDMEYLWPDLVPLATDHTLIHYDQRGGGRSELPEDTTLLAIEYHIRDLEALRKHFGIGRLTILAHSFGPALAALYAIDHPDRVEGMIFIGPVPPRRGGFFDRYSANLASRLQPEEQKRIGELWPTRRTYRS